MFRLIALAGIAIFAAGGARAADEATLFTVAYIEVGPVLAKLGAATLRSYRDAAESNQGVVSLEVYQRVERPNQLIVLGAWSGPMAFEANQGSEPTKKLNEKLATMLAAPPDVRQHASVTLAPIKAGKDPIMVVTHVDVIPAQKDAALDVLKKLADDSRRQPGNERFDVWQQKDRPNHFTLVETWSNRGALDLHAMQKDTREFRSKLAPMLGALYDERVYKVVK